MPWLCALFCGCFWGRCAQVGRVSLNRSEQRLHEYIEANREERHFWQQKVRKLQSELVDTAAVTHRLEAELWRYNVERSSVVRSLKEAAAHEGLKRISLRNLADYLLRMWGMPLKPKKPVEPV